MSTPSSGSTAYATPNDMVAYYDFRSVGELLTDDNVTQVLIPNAITGAGPLNTLLLKLLMAAAGLIEAACTKGGNYVINVTAIPPVNDLAALTGNSKEMLTEMNCDLTMWKLWKRRPTLAPRELPVDVRAALENLDRLEKGEWIFGILEKQAAGALSDYVETPTDVYNRNGVVFQARKIFGRRSNQYPSRDDGR
jgi:phage gp36-like protein